MVINVPEGSNKEGAVSNGYMIRRTTVDFGISLLTNIKVAKLFVEAFAKKNAKGGFALAAQRVVADVQQAVGRRGWARSYLPSGLVSSNQCTNPCDSIGFEPIGLTYVRFDSIRLATTKISYTI